MMLHARRLDVVLQSCLQLLQLSLRFWVEVGPLAAVMAGQCLSRLKALIWLNLLILGRKTHAMLLCARMMLACRSHPLVSGGWMVAALVVSLMFGCCGRCSVSV